MESLMQVATRHMANGVEDLDELARLVEQDTGRVPNRRVLSAYRSHYRRHGAAWMDAFREATRAAGRRNRDSNPEAHREKRRNQYAKNPEAGRAACRRWGLKNPATKLLQQCRQSAKRRGQECTITVEMIDAMLGPMTCSATGLPLTLQNDSGSVRNPWAPSVDRFDNSKGYVPGNVRIVCAIFNMMRADWSDDALLRVVKVLADRAPA